MKNLLINNFALHYRESIFRALDQTGDFDFIFGDRYFDIKDFDHRNFKGSVCICKNIIIKSPIYYQTKVISTLFKKYDNYIILGETICVSTWIFLLLSKLLGKNVYTWTHGWYGKESKIRIILKKIFFNLPKSNFLYGEYAKKLMIKQGFSDRKLIPIYNSLDYVTQKKIRESITNINVIDSHFGYKSFKLIFIGRLTKVKHLDLLLEALSILNNEQPLYTLTIIGSGSELESLKSQAVKLNLSSVIWFFGEAYDENILGPIIYHADLTVSPGNVGLTAMHSMAYGTPVITHNDFPYQMPEFEAIIPGKSGCFFQRNSIDSLVKSIDFWFSSLYVREEIRTNCYNVIESKYNADKQASIILSTLKEL